MTIEAATLGQLFEAAADAFADAVVEEPRRTIRPAVTRALDLEAPELDLLLRDWLHEILFLFDAESLLIGATSVSVRRAEDRFRLHADLMGETLDPARHAIKVLIKAVTYHGLEARHTPDGWRATVVFDI